MVKVTSALKVCAFQIHFGPITSSYMVEFENYLAEMIITTRRCVTGKNRVARSNSRHFKFVHSRIVSKLITSFQKLVRFENYLAEMITTRQCVMCKNHVPGQSSRSQSTLTASYVQPIISSGMVGFENYLAQMIIKTRQCVLFKNHVATQKTEFKVRTYMHRLE